MNLIEKQVRRAHRRLLIATFLQNLGWAVFGCLLLAVAAIALPKITTLNWTESPEAYTTWVRGWSIGAAAAGVLIAGVMTWVRHVSILNSAVEVDSRYKLKERLSTALSLSPDDLGSPVGQALLADAEKRAETIDVRDQFRIQPGWRIALPLIPVCLVGLLMLVPNAQAKPDVEPDNVVSQADHTKAVIEEARKKLKQKLAEMEAKGLKDANLDIESLAKKIDNLSKDSNETDKRDALIKLNDVKKQLEERKRALGDGDALKDQLQKLKDVSQGPAKKLNEALNDGDFEEAKKAIKDLAEKLRDGKLNEVEKKQLAKDMQAMADELKKLAEKHEQEKQELQKKLDEAIKKGDLEQAAKLQQKLERKKDQDAQMEKMKKMAEKLQKCSDCMQGNQQGKAGQKEGGQQPGEQSSQPSQGDLQDAAQSLEDLAEEIEKMQESLEELEDLEDMMEEIEQAKGQCQGGGDPNGPPKWNDWAKGKGPGGGARDKEDEDTGTYKSRVKGKIQRGETVVTGNADGENLPGRTVSEVRELIQSSVSKESDPLEDQQLPKSQREHVQQYFEKLRTGK